MDKMRSVLCFWICLLLVGATQGQQSSVVNMTVYYETLCPASMEYITQQVYPVWRLFGKTYINLELIPYGKAVQGKLSDGRWGFRCQHGPPECIGNKLQVCGLETLKRSPNSQVKFVNCVMSSSTPANSLTSCIDGLATRDKNAISTCYLGVKGDDLLAEYGDKTHALVPPIRLVPNTGHVPTTVFNGVYSDQDDSEAFTDLKAFVCKKLRIKTKCKNTY